jgi:hypothetical protein
MPVIKFDNLSVPLEGKAVEQEVKDYADQNRQAEGARNLAPTIKENVRERLDKMTPDELKKLENQLGSEPAPKQ